MRQYNNSRGRYKGGRSNGNRNRNSWKQKAPGYRISDFINTNPESIQEENFIPSFQYSELNVNEGLKQNILKKGYQSPTPIQDKTIALSLEGKDIIGLANTGTGKTAAFLIPLIEKVIKKPNERVLIIAPTRELATQIDDELYSFVSNLRVYSALCIGGASINRQMYDLRGNPQFVIGTPGRLKDLANRGVLKLQLFSSIVLDEVDRMLDMGFLPDIKWILNGLAQPRQSLFFSATLPNEIKEIINNYMQNPITISVCTGATAKNIHQDVITHKKGEDKTSILINLLNQNEHEKMLIFAQTKRMVDKLTRSLEDNGVRVSSIHGDKSQGQREKSLRQFKSNAVHVLIATDVAARGLDISNISHVVNYDLPQTYEDYIHRIGRTGRAGKKGKAITFFEQ